MPFDHPEFAWQRSVVRNDELSHAQVNLLGNNVQAVDEELRVEHLADGTHNALEVPWLLGHVEGITGYVFDPTYGGTAIANSSTGEYDVDIEPAVIPAAAAPQYGVLANVNDEAIDAKPHIITTELLGEQNLALRIRWLTSSLGSGNSWALVDRNFDVAVHAPQKTPDISQIAAYQPHSRGDFLTHAATDWNAVVVGQAQTHKALGLEHTNDGLHNVNRVARAVGWFRPIAGPSYEIASAEGVASVTRDATGIITVATVVEFNSLEEMVCFPVVQPAAAGELIIINGRALTTQSFRFFIYAYSGGSWSRVDRPFFSPMFGVLK